MKQMGWLVFGCIGLMGVVGCTAVPTRLESNYRTSYTLARGNQILTPEAVQNLEPVHGFDGRAAQETLNRYQKSFAQPEPPRFVLPAAGFGAR